MTNKKGTKRALLTSVLALVMCVSMLIGTTFAWFTDSVTSGTNIIAAGNLDVEVYNSLTVGENKVDSNTKLFDHITYWEPGVAAYENLTVANEGTLALKYQLSVIFDNATTNANGDTLAEVLKVGFVEGGIQSTTREGALAEVKTWLPLASFAQNGELLKGDHDTYGIVIWWKPSDIDNEFNMNNDNKGKVMSIDLGIKLVATQKMHESDSFGPNYDALANKWDGSIGEVPAEDNNVITITTGAELAAFAASVNNGNSYSGKTVQLGADINLGNQPWTSIGDCESGKYFRGTFDGKGYTIYNLSVDYSNDPSKNATAGLFGWVDAAGATIKNVNLENATVMGSHWVGAIAGYFTGRIENCSVNNSTIMGFNVNDDANGDKVGGIVGFLNEHSYINNNTVSNTDITGNRDIGGIAGSVAASTYEMKNNTVKDTTLCYSEEKSYASAGEIVSGRTGYVADTTNVATNVTITRVINVKTVAELNSALAALSGNALSTAAILQNCNEPNGVVQIPADYTGVLTLKDSSIGSVQAADKANIVVAGNVKVDASGLANTSAITGVELNISGNGNLIAIANGKHAFGIGGDQTTNITLENVHIVDVKGGYVKSTITDNNYGKNENEGGAAIGSGKDGAVINLIGVTIDNAQGGSKAAGIGAQFHTGVTINITNSTIKNVEGGNSSAGIGGSRMTKHEAGDTQNVTITITNSTVNAKGGDFGAGIGSGYNTYCSGVTPDPVISVTIDANSVITATGGLLGAGIGTGHNAVGFVGNIDCDTSNVKAGSSEDPSWCCWGNPCTTAEDIGLGVLSIKNFPNKFGKYVSSAEEMANAVANGETNFYLADGEYNIYGCGGKTLTLSGSKNAVLLVTHEGEYGCDYGFDGSTVTFNGVTLDTKKANGQTWPNYARMNGTFNNCTFNGTYAPNRVNSFTGCTFNVTGNNYNLWLYGASTVSFEECTFNCDGKSIYVDGNGATGTNVTIKKCTFNDNGDGTAVNDKAAIETGKTYGQRYELIINETTVNGFVVNPTGLSTNSTLWANKHSMGTDVLNVVIDGVDVY